MQYNKAFINRRSLTFWIGKKAIQLWNQTKQGHHGRLRLFGALAITTVCMVQCVFLMPRKGLQDSLILLSNLLNCHCHAITIHALASKPKRLTFHSI
ncbi:transposase [Candidatus Enterovibrio altilux]|uniref:transposase n=1 Tax=Candidatus Enterovibrio altilux TaxID=1927128 RepID=UPI000BBC10EF|nr:transposase [Candidatus Enterovibrio luxaltus]